MAKVKFSHDFHAIKEGRHIKADEPVELTEERAKEIVANIKRDFDVVVKVDIVEPDEKADDQDEVNLVELELKQLKEIADERGIEYAKNATKETMLELLQGEE